jgi:hypothetical protein
LADPLFCSVTLPTDKKSRRLKKEMGVRLKKDDLKHEDPFLKYLFSEDRERE